MSTVTGAGSTVASLFRSAVRCYPDRVAIEHDGRQLSYAELLFRVERIASLLIALDTRGTRRYAVLSENRAEYLEVQLAAAWLGGAVSCLNWRLSPAELLDCIELVEPAVLVCSERHSAKLSGLHLPPLSLIALGPEWERRIDSASRFRPDDTVSPEAPWLVLYTGGSTGRPKGAILSQRAEIARMSSWCLDFGLRPGDTDVAWPPLFHMGGAEPALLSLLTGGRVIVEDGFDADRLAVHIEREPQLHWISIQPGSTGRLIEALERRGTRPAALRTCGVMPDLVPRTEVARLTSLLGAAYCNSFGSTETGTPPLSGGWIEPGRDDYDLAKLPSALVEIRLLDESGCDADEGEVGEITVKGPTLFSGYWQDAAATDAAFSDGWYRMGDLARRRADGRFEFVDRAKYLIKSGGENIYPAEIEQALLASGEVSDVVVVRRTDPRWGEVPVALVVAKRADVDAGRLAAWCRTRIASFKQPKEIIFVPAERLARNSLGKVSRKELENWVERTTRERSIE